MRDHKGDTVEVGAAAIGAGVLVASITLTSIADVGAPESWAWVLTGLQVVALRTAATGNRRGWLVGASVQFPWMAYAVVTAQYGFIPGCLISGLIQVRGYLRPGNQQEKHLNYA